ncbi:MAG: hypothetical protein CVU56_26290 [Deltaproteobacteria bacterium HGW-Deltaproteobacteria-14]|jgi:hypothetical protein|nr:MAG: hypothetical protein CVU56_26290 [Deltaproteobacteria bacterium HGW-Deltaproteobacteria-14]
MSFVRNACIALFVLVPALGLAACDPIPDLTRDLGESCQEDLDCVSYYSCSGGVCVDPYGGGGSSSSSGGYCGRGGADCYSGTCCSGYLCITDDWECAASCSSSWECNSGCCIALQSGRGACGPAASNLTCK